MEYVRNHSISRFNTVRGTSTWYGSPWSSEQKRRCAHFPIMLSYCTCIMYGLTWSTWTPNWGDQWYSNRIFRQRLWCSNLHLKLETVETKLKLFIATFLWDQVQMRMLSWEMKRIAYLSRFQKTMKSAPPSLVGLNDDFSYCTPIMVPESTRMIYDCCCIFLKRNQTFVGTRGSWTRRSMDAKLTRRNSFCRMSAPLLSNVCTLRRVSMKTVQRKFDIFLCRICAHCLMNNANRCDNSNNDFAHRVLDTHANESMSVSVKKLWEDCRQGSLGLLWGFTGCDQDAWIKPEVRTSKLAWSPFALQFHSHILDSEAMQQSSVQGRVAISDLWWLYWDLCMLDSDWTWFLLQYIT